MKEVNEKHQHQLEDKDKDKDKDNQFIYLLRTREFVNAGRNIYKLGRTTKQKSRMGSYPRGSIVYFMSKCGDCVESETILLDIFDKKFTKMSYIGNEYFEGNLNEMINEMMDNINI